MKGSMSLAAIGKLAAAELRDTIKAARDPGDVAEIERRADQQEWLNAAGARVLLGDDFPFVRLEPKK